MEEWRDIEGYEGLYQVSNYGNIYSIRKKRNYTLSVGTNGYVNVTLTKNGKKLYTSVHQLVAQAFIQNPDNKPCVGHLDCDRTNNKAENLYWCTYLENMNHPITRQRLKESKTGKKNPNFGKEPWNKGKKLSKEQIAKMSSYMKERLKDPTNHPMYGRKGEDNPLYGRERPEEVRKKISKGLTGKKLSEERKAKLSESHKGKPTSRSRDIVQLTLDEEFVAIHKTAPSGFNRSIIYQCCKKKRNKHGNFKWMYKDDYDAMMELNIVCQ